MNSSALKSKMLLTEKNVDVIISELVAKHEIKMNRSTFYRKLNGTSEFDRKEIKAISEILKLSDEEVLNVFFDKKVS